MVDFADESGRMMTCCHSGDALPYRRGMPPSSPSAGGVGDRPFARSFFLFEPSTGTVDQGDYSQAIRATTKEAEASEKTPQRTEGQGVYAGQLERNEEQTMNHRSRKSEKQEQMRALDECIAQLNREISADNLTEHPLSDWESGDKQADRQANLERLEARRQRLQEEIDSLRP